MSGHYVTSHASIDQKVSMSQNCTEQPNASSFDRSERPLSLTRHYEDRPRSVSHYQIDKPCSIYQQYPARPRAGSLKQSASHAQTCRSRAIFHYQTDRPLFFPDHHIVQPSPMSQGQAAQACSESSELPLPATQDDKDNLNATFDSHETFGSIVKVNVPTSLTRQLEKPVIGEITPLLSSIDVLQSSFTVIRLIPFSSKTKVAYVVVKRSTDGSVFILTKGAPESILKRCSTYSEPIDTKPYNQSTESPARLPESFPHQTWSNTNIVREHGIKMLLTEEFAAKLMGTIGAESARGQKVVAIALNGPLNLTLIEEARLASDQHMVDTATLYNSFNFIGYLSISDLPRVEVKDAIAAIRGAGIVVAMITGDSSSTAVAIARSVGIIDDHKTAAPPQSPLQWLSFEPSPQQSENNGTWLTDSKLSTTGSQQITTSPRNKGEVTLKFKEYSPITIETAREGKLNSDIYFGIDIVGLQSSRLLNVCEKPTQQLKHRCIESSGREIFGTDSASSLSKVGRKNKDANRRGVQKILAIKPMHAVAAERTASQREVEMRLLLEQHELQSEGLTHSDERKEGTDIEECVFIKPPLIFGTNSHISIGSKTNEGAVGSREVNGYETDSSAEYVEDLSTSNFCCVVGETSRGAKSPEKDITLAKVENTAVLVHGADIEALSNEDWDFIFAHTELIFARTTPEHKLQVIAVCILILQRSFLQ